MLLSRSTTPVAAIGLLIVAAQALATTPTTLNFTRVTNTNPEALGSQLSVLVAPVPSEPNKIDFSFRNNVGIPSNVSEIYFDDGTLLAGSILMQMGTVFVFGGANPANLPSGNTVVPPFVATQQFSSDAQGMNGINGATDVITIRFDLQAGNTCDDVLAALDDGSLRIGLHVRSIGAGGGSDSYVNGSPPPTGDIGCSISGPSLVCPGDSNTYTATETTGITSPAPTFAWTITGDGTFPGDMTTATGPSVTVNAADTCMGMYSLEVTVTSGNLSDTCTLMASVGDTTPPDFDDPFPMDTTVECPAGSFGLTAPTATDNCGGMVTITPSDSTVSACAGTGVITRTWTATDECGNSASMDQIITVVDTTDPIFESFPMNMTVECGDPTTPGATGTPTGSDTCGTVDITSVDDFAGDCGDTGVITRTWTVTDACGRSVSRDQIITIVDTTPPVVECPSDITIVFVDGSEEDPEVNPAVGTATGSDDCGDVTITYTDFVTHGTGSIVHVIERTWKATDECGLMDTCVQIITVTDKCIWTQGEWDGVDGQTSETDTAVEDSRTADDFCLKEGYVYEINAISVCMLTNSTELNATLEIREDNGGCPGDIIDCGTFETFTVNMLQPECVGDLDLVKFTFNTGPRTVTDEYGNTEDKPGLWLKGGCYWISPVGIGDGSNYDRYFWATAGDTIIGAIPKTQVAPFKIEDWEPVDGLNVTCRNFAFELAGDCCCILQDNGGPDVDDVNGAVDTTGVGCFNADDFVVPLCADPNDICFFSAYIWTNCDCERTKLSILWDDCGEILAADLRGDDGVLPSKCVDTGRTIQFDDQELTLYRVEWHNPAIRVGRPGANAWAAIEVQGSGSLQERGIWAFADRCGTDADQRFNPGQAVCPPQGIFDYESVNRDYSFCLATRERAIVSEADPAAAEPACAADFNGDGSATITDMLDFLDVFFEGCEN